MFDKEGYEIGIPMTGYLLSVIFLLLLGFFYIGNDIDISDIFTNGAAYIIALVGILLLITGYLCLKNSYLLDGMSFILTAIVAICIAIENMRTDPVKILGGIVQIVMAVAFILVAYLAYMSNEDHLAIANVLWAVIMILSLPIITDNASFIFIICGIVAIINAILEAYMCRSDWQMLNEMNANYEGRLTLRKKKQ